MAIYVRQGETGFLAVYVEDRSNQPTDPDTETLTFTLEDDAATPLAGYPSQSYTRLSQGYYRFGLDTTGLEPGHYLAVWNAVLSGEVMTPAVEDVYVTAAVAETTDVFTSTTELSLIRGDTATFAFALVRGGRPVPLTGAAIRFTAKRSLADGDAVFTKTIDDGLTVTDAEGGRIDVTFNAPDTRDLDAPLTLVWDLEVTEAGGTVSTPLIGTLRLDADVRETGTGVGTGLVVTPRAVRALVPTALSDTDLQDVIVREQQLLAAEIGPLVGLRTETFTITDQTARRSVRLRRRTAAVTVTQNNVSTTDVRVLTDERSVELLTGSGWAPGTWTGAVEVTYSPNDLARVTSWVIELVRARLTETGFDSETIGAYSYARGDRSHAQVLAAAIADIVGKGSSSGSRAIRSIVMSTASPGSWIGTVRP